MVPNVPCGVESKLFLEWFLSEWEVPNAPCGVENLELKEKGLNF
jgi:hypothetical protein